MILVSKHIKTPFIKQIKSQVRHCAIRKMSLVVLGNPLLDLQADVPESYLEKYELKANDAILAEEKHMPIYKEILEFPKLHTLAGGAAQNSARGAQYLLPEGAVTYFGSVGQDQYQELLQKANEKAGVTTRYQVHKDIPTGKCAALITGTNRSLVTDLAAANHFKLEHLQKPENWAYVEKAQFFYVGGFHLTVCPPAINALGKHAADNNKVFAINLSAPFLCQFFKDPMDDSAKYWDFLIGNETEALAYAESHDLKTTSIEEIAKAIALLPKENKQRNRTVIITQGLEPTVVVVGDLNAGTTTTKTYEVHPIESKSIVDSNGAGDAFAGGFLAGLVQGKDLDTSIDIGQWLAKESLQQVGPDFPYPKIPYPN